MTPTRRHAPVRSGPRIVRRAPMKRRGSPSESLSRFPIWIGVGVVVMLAIPVVAVVWPA